MSNSQCTAPQAPDAAPSPFLDSVATDPPLLRPLRHPTTAVAEMLQKTVPAAVELPVRRRRGDKRVYFESPAKTSSAAFKQSYHGFMSANICVATSSGEEALLMVAAESKELSNFAASAAAVDGSLPPRGVAISLVLPDHCNRSGETLHLIDGFSAISQIVGTDGASAASTCRFSMFGDTAVAPALSHLASVAFGPRTVPGPAILLSWTEAGALGSAALRCEASAATKAVQSAQEAANHLQALITSLAREFGVRLPAALHLPAQARDLQFENMVKSSAEAFLNMLHYEAKFSATAAMDAYACNRLQVVPGVFVRLSAKARGAGGVTDDEALHGLLLCADGRADEARAFAIQHREGLPSCAGGKNEALLLHVAAAQCERIHLASTVSLYGVCGVPGKPISPPGTVLYRSVADIVPLDWLQIEHFALSCEMKSVIPTEKALVAHVNENLRRATDVYNRAFNSKFEVRAAPPEPPWPPPSAEDKFLFAALGLNLRSQRTCLGEAIVQLMETNAAPLLVDMLVKTGECIGLSASLEQAFASAFEAMRRAEAVDKAHILETSRLKRVAEAALLVGCKRKAVEAARDSAFEKVRSALKSNLLVNGTARCKTSLATPRSLAMARSLSAVVVEAYTQIPNCESPHMDEMTNIFVNHESIAHAVAKAFRICMLEPNTTCDAFIIEHGIKSGRATVRRVDCDLVDSSAGELFEANSPRVVLIKWHAGRCLVTAMVRTRESR